MQLKTKSNSYPELHGVDLANRRDESRRTLWISQTTWRRIKARAP
ncbi:hypothetical protein [Petrotoga olearia]|nr:hypothetical protein [Petrotoga olearia]